jgi:hypothetical protein
MANYTVELRTIVDSGYNIFDFPYEFYDNEKKPIFEAAFIRHFKYREICSYPVARWNDYLQDTFTTILPYYNRLFLTDQIKYNETENYNITETQKHDITSNNTVNGTAKQSGNNKSDGSTNSQNHHEADNTTNGNKTNTLDSTTDHTDHNEFTKDETIADTSKNEKSSTKSLDATKVNSDTPQAQLSIGDLKSNIFASTVEINDNGETSKDSENITANKTGKNHEVTDHTTKDIVNGVSKDNYSDTSKEVLNETITGSQTNNTNFATDSNTSQNSLNVQNETFTRTMKGSYGVITEADMIKKSIDLQMVLKNSLNNFFNECEGLFMQVYEMEGL